MIIAIISIAAAVLLALYVGKSQDYKALERDNKWLKVQREQTSEPVAIDDVDNHPLDKETAMEAVRYNGAWKKWAQYVSSKTEYSIQRCGGDETEQDEKNLQPPRHIPNFLISY